jgi:predicted phosphodiesterase
MHATLTPVVRTLVISDLHLGARTGVAVLHRPAPLEALLAALEGVDRLVLLGDTVELRQGPADEALAAARPVLAALAEALGGGELLVVPGNHDHGIVRRPLVLGVEATVEYPGTWLREDVHATHGHYLDVHGTVPSFERIGAGLMAKMVGAPPELGAAAEDYEAILAPIYAWIEEAAEHARDGRRAAGSGRSGAVWSAMSNTGRRTVRNRALLASFPVGIATLNRIGVGPLSRDLSGPALRRGLLGGMQEALRRLGIEAPHVVFGHTHRTGPLPADDLSEWRTATTQLHNCGSWVFEPRFIANGGPEAPHWPGGAVLLEDDEPPRLVRLLEGLSSEQLRV